jgi:hypothetical protein
MPGYFPTSQVSVQLTGTSSVPNNFTVDIYRWDVTTDAAVYDRTIVTGLTRTTTSSVNSGSLVVSPYYGITGITGLDNYVKLTSTTSCSTTATQDITTAALTVYQPSSGTFTNIYNNYPTSQGVTFNQTGTGSGEDSFAVTGSPGSQTITGGYHTVAVFSTLSYINASGFTLSYVSGKNLAGDTIYGDYANGPFSSFSITQSGKLFTLRGNTNTSLAPDNTTIKGIIRLTHDLSTNYIDFDYWYKPIDA